MSNNLAHVRAREATDWLAGYDPGDGHGLIGALATDPAGEFTQPVVVAAYCAGADRAVAPGTEDEVNAIIAGLIRDAQVHGLDDDADERADDAAKRIAAYLGAIHREEQDQWSIERATGQRQLDDARALMVETAELLRGYEAHHRGKIMRFPGTTDRPENVAALKQLQEKVDRNALAAARLEAWIAGEDRYPVSLNPAEVLRGIATETAAVLGLGVDHDSFDQAARSLDEMVFPAADPGVPIPTVTGWIDRDGKAHPDEPPLYLIRKGGAYYRPNAQGYTRDRSEAGRYTLEEAIRHSHPNGPDGPRDGITYEPAEPDVPGEDTVVAHGRPTYGPECGLDPEIVEALRASAGEVDDSRSAEACRAKFDNVESFTGGPVPIPGRPHHRPQGVADLLAFRLTTGDPRFDPLAPVCVNGYLYRPAKEN